MLFNSLSFAIFMIIVFILYWFVIKKLKLQNLFIVAISYLFYGWWDWRFLILIATTTLLSYLSGVLIDKYRTSKRKTLMITASNVIINLAILCVFKYFNFFGDNLYKLFSVFGFALDWVTLDILLPVGISFYTFQALSYTIDVYHKKIAPTYDIVSFFAYVSFFPQLVAGPIERATNLLPQFYVKREFNYYQASEGCRQILWGLFKKIVVADNCAIIVNTVFASYDIESGVNLLIAGIAFTFQIYGDFSGYSDIAIGTSKLLGFNLKQNFNVPLFSRDIAEFWRRWHISLTTWFRDYIYIPLGGSKRGKLISIRNTIIIFLVSGFWHGANWTFIAWGAYHSLLFVPLLIAGKNRKYVDVVANNSLLPNIKECFQMLSTFLLVMVGFIIFRSDTISVAYHYIVGIFDWSLFSLPTGINVKYFVIVVSSLLVIEWFGRHNSFALEVVSIKSPILRYAFYWALVVIIISMGVFTNQEYIYFQF